MQSESKVAAPLKARPVDRYNGSPLVPTGDPMIDDGGPAAWADRADHPDWTVYGEAKIVPIRVTNNRYWVNPKDPNPIGLPVIAVDKVEAGRVLEVWVDRSEPQVRYYEIQLTGSEERRLVPAPFVQWPNFGLWGYPAPARRCWPRAIAAAIGGRFGRVQCTPDLLPTDITGTSVFRPDTAEWQFRPGPVFANVVLVDEVNRASPRTQSALLEPMEEHQVTVDGTTWALPDPFFCIATQNPFGQIGTFPLPESQLDRFALALSLGLPDRDAEREIVTGAGGVDVLRSLHAVTDPGEVAAAIDATAATHCDAEGRRVRARPDRGDPRRAPTEPGRLAAGVVGAGAPGPRSRRGGRPRLRDPRRRAGGVRRRVRPPGDGRRPGRHPRPRVRCWRG